MVCVWGGGKGRGSPDFSMLGDRVVRGGGGGKTDKKGKMAELGTST